MTFQINFKKAFLYWLNAGSCHETNPTGRTNFPSSLFHVSLICLLKVCGVKNSHIDLEYDIPLRAINGIFSVKFSLNTEKRCYLLGLTVVFHKGCILDILGLFWTLCKQETKTVPIQQATHLFCKIESERESNFK